MKFIWDFSLSLNSDEISNSIRSVLMRLAFFLVAWIFLEISLAKPSASSSGVNFVSSFISNSVSFPFSNLIFLILSSSFIIWYNSSLRFLWYFIVAFESGHLIPIWALSLSFNPCETIHLTVSISCSSFL